MRDPENEVASLELGHTVNPALGPYCHGLGPIFRPRARLVRG